MWLWLAAFLLMVLIAGAVGLMAGAGIAVVTTEILLLVIALLSLVVIVGAMRRRSFN